MTEWEKQRAKVLKKLATCPIQEISGVVAPKGKGGGQSQGERFCTFQLPFDGWRIKGGEIQTRPFRAFRTGLKLQEMPKLMKQFKPYSVIRMKARFLDDPALGEAYALFDTGVKADRSDAELNRHAEELQKPVIFKDPLFGKFQLDRAFDYFTANVSWGGEDAVLILEKSARVDESLEAARTLWKSERTWNRRIQDYAVEKLLPLKNKTWLAEAEAKLTAKEFKAGMKPAVIDVWPDGRFSFSHDVGEMFGDHMVVVKGNLVDGPKDADIEG